ncbi:MAG: DNA polymerase IV [Actinomycetota bacterium]
MGAASILHADLDAFYASVEQRDDPRLRGRPVIVGEGVVMAASYEARACGVRSAMNGRQARELCPHAVVVAPRMEAYSEASDQVFELFRDITPFVEPISVDEAFLDVGGATHLFGPPSEIAARLRTRTLVDVGLPLSVGVARTKFLAKVASGQAKPDGLCVVEHDREISFLHPLPVGVLWGVGPVTAAKLNDHGIETVGDLAASGRAELQSMLGPSAGRHLRALAHNHDPRPVDNARRDRSMGAQRALGTRVRTRDELRTILTGLAEKVAARLRRADRVCRTVTVRYRSAEMKAESRSRTLLEPTASTETLTDVADALLLALVDGPHGPGSRLGRVGCSLVGITYSGLGRSDAVQLALRFPEQGRPTDRLDDAIDSIRDRWGGSAMARASLLGDRGGLPVLQRPTALDAAPRSPAGTGSPSQERASAGAGER